MLSKDHIHNKNFAANLLQNYYFDCCHLTSMTHKSSKKGLFYRDCAQSMYAKRVLQWSIFS